MNPFTIYQDKRGKYRWRIKGVNGEIVGASSQGFTSRYRCRSNADLLRMFLPRVTGK